MNLNRLLILHAIVTFAAGVVLIVSPELIPASVDVELHAGAYLICYLLGACEVSLAVLSYYSTRLRDRQALQLVCLTFIVLHGLTATVELYALTQGASRGLWANLAVRVFVVGLFSYYGFIKQPR